MKVSEIKYDCRHFKGYIPCKPNKQFGVFCIDESGNDCKYYDQFTSTILIIKIGAIGDVIRTTPLFTKLKREFPGAKIYWLTETPAVIPKEVDDILSYDFKSIEYLKTVEFDLVINLDKDKDASALMKNLKTKEKRGFILADGSIKPTDALAEHKFLTGLFDDLSKKNKKNYMEEMFDIAGYKYDGEKYTLDSFNQYKNDWNIDKSKKVIGLNTGCGGRWISRLWKDEYWIKLTDSLTNSGYEVIFLGGEIEDEKNKLFAERTMGKYLGHFHLEKFINLVNQCDLVVTAVTMAMHITIALEKKIVLFNNIFNKYEFELFGLGEIVEPSIECDCYFSPTCPNNCMDYVEPERVFSSVKKLLS